MTRHREVAELYAGHDDFKGFDDFRGSSRNLGDPVVSV
jgi:hypothetical protein